VLWEEGEGSDGISTLAWEDSGDSDGDHERIGAMEGLGLVPGAREEGETEDGKRRMWY
jgi:hypothetical protein